MKIALISGKGGTGKSSIASAFITIAQNSIAVDCDVDASNLYMVFDPVIVETLPYISGQHAWINTAKCTRCGTCEEHCSFGAIQRNESGLCVNSVLCEGCKLCYRVCPHNAIEMHDSTSNMLNVATFRYGTLVYGKLAPGEDNSGKFISKVREVANNIQENQDEKLQILDGPPGIGCPVISTITGVDKIFIVTEPTLSGISDLERAHEVAASFCKNIYVIINKFDLDLNNTNLIAQWCNNVGANLVAKLPFDRQMVEAVINRQSIIEYNPNCECSQLIEQAFHSIMDH